MDAEQYSRRLEQKEKIQLRKCAPDAGGGLSEPDPAEGKAFRPEGASSGNGGSGRHTDYDGDHCPSGHLPGAVERGDRRTAESENHNREKPYLQYI